ncbi:MAG: FliH/SctL family protein [Acidobacteriaceae bacterium]|nr:FliH/SctL family protein [Acidobacteriaceae bacterium]
MITPSEPISLAITALSFEDLSGEPEQDQESVEEHPVDTPAQVVLNEQIYEERIAQERVRIYEELQREFELRVQEKLQEHEDALKERVSAFERARHRYFLDVEREIVQLALGIASQILHRELAMDATVLTGVVHAALEKINTEETVVLEVPSADAARWREAMKNGSLQVEGKEDLESGELNLRLPNGMAQLGVHAQLAEIERGFCDLLSKRPAA